MPHENRDLTDEIGEVCLVTTIINNMLLLIKSLPVVCRVQ